MGQHGRCRRGRQRVRCPSGLALAVTLALGLASACGEPDPDPYQPLSQACDDCLLEAGSMGCGDQYDECEREAACEDVVLCQLLQQCYREPAEGDCSEQRGCIDGSTTDDELESAHTFESCARTTCGHVCDFEP